MPATVDQLYQQAFTLSPEARADLLDRLVAIGAEDLDPEIEAAHLQEVERRLARVEAGEEATIPGEEALARARVLLASFSTTTEPLP